MKFNKNVIDATSNTFYNKLANNFKSYRLNRIKYNNSIDDILIKYLDNSLSWLDIGCGDGQRILNISKKLRKMPKKIFCLEPAEKMFILAKKNLENYHNFQLMNQSFSQFSTEFTFSRISALWNVVGHISNRKEFFKQVFNCLEIGGYFLFDANNRFNIKNYGIKNFIINLFNELINSPNKGFFPLFSESYVQISSPHEIKKELSKAGFEILDIIYIDYNDGKITNSILKGQSLFICIKR